MVDNLPKLDGSLTVYGLAAPGDGRSAMPAAFRTSTPVRWTTWSLPRATSPHKTACGRWTCCAATLPASWPPSSAAPRWRTTACSARCKCAPPRTTPCGRAPARPEALAASVRARSERLHRRPVTTTCPWSSACSATRPPPGRHATPCWSNSPCSRTSPPASPANLAAKRSPLISRPNSSPTSTRRARGATIPRASRSRSSPRRSRTSRTFPSTNRSPSCARPDRGNTSAANLLALDRPSLSSIPPAAPALRAPTRGPSPVRAPLQASRYSRTTCTLTLACPSLWYEADLDATLPSAARRLPRCRRYSARHALRHHRPQRSRGLGLHQPRRRCAGSLHRAHPRHHRPGPNTRPPTAPGTRSTTTPKSSTSAAAPTLSSMSPSPVTATTTRPIISSIFPGETPLDQSAMDHLRPRQRHRALLRSRLRRRLDFDAQRLLHLGRPAAKPDLRQTIRVTSATTPSAASRCAETSTIPARFRPSPPTPPRPMPPRMSGSATFLSTSFPRPSIRPTVSSPPPTPASPPTATASPSRWTGWRPTAPSASTRCSRPARGIAQAHPGRHAGPPERRLLRTRPGHCAAAGLLHRPRHRPAEERQALHQAADLLRKWNGKVDADAAAPAIVNAARAAFWPMLLIPKLAPAARLSACAGRGPVQAKNLSRGRCPNRQPLAGLHLGRARQRRGGADDAHSRALAALRLRHLGRLPRGSRSARPARCHAAPRDLNTWQQGKAFPLDIEHPILSRSDCWSGT